MYSPFFKKCACVLCLTPGAFAFSLYDSAPTVGLPESQAAAYSLNLRAGYDTNPGCNTGRKRGSAFANASLSTTYRDIEATDKITYEARLGATYYFAKEDPMSHGGADWKSDCMVGATLTHAFSAMSQNTIGARVTYKPEPDYDNGISAHNRRGNCLTWNVHDTYHQAIDSRWSWNVGASYSGTRYEDKGYGNFNDNRQYINGSAGLAFRASEQTTYTANFSAGRRLRQKGLDSNTYTLTVGINQAIDTMSSYNITVGVQDTVIVGENRFSPTMSAAYNRQVTEGLSMRAYVRFSNENTDSYRGNNLSYKDVLTWRIGADATYRISPDLSVKCGGTLLFSDYRAGQQGLAGENRTCYDAHVSLNYKFSNSLTGDISCRYNAGHYDRKARTDRYDRVETSCGLSYHF